MNRIVVYHNPKSSTHTKYLSSVRKPLVKYAHTHPDHEFMEITISQPFNKTVKSVTKYLRDGDTVIAAGGDGTISAIMNGCMKSCKDVTFGVLGLGRGNDAARTINGRIINPIALLSRPTVEIYPLEILANNRHVRFAMQHVALGAAAEASIMFDQQSRRGRNFSSQSIAAGTAETIRYLKEVKGRVDELFPLHLHNGETSNNNVICLANGRVAKIFYPKVSGERTRSTHGDVNNFLSFSARIVGTANDVSVIASWAIGGAPCDVTSSETFLFAKPVDLTLAVDGEALDITTSKLRIRKAKNALRTFAPELAKF